MALKSFRIEQPVFYLASITLAFFAGVALAPRPVSVGVVGPGDISSNTAMIMGNDDAPVKMVEFADPLCPYCVKFGTETEQKLRKNYIDSGKLQFEYKPIAIISKNSERAVESLYCAADQQQFWPYLDSLHAELSRLYAEGKQGNDLTIFEDDNLESLARGTELNAAEFKSCVSSGKHEATVLRANGEATGFRIQGTPTFYVNDKIYSGATDYDVLETLIKAQL